MRQQLIDTLNLTGRGVISLIGAGGKTSLMFRLAKELSGSGKTVLTTTTTKLFMPEPEQSRITLIEAFVDELIKKATSCLDRHPHLSAGSCGDPTTGKLNGYDPDQINQVWQAGLFDWIIVEADGARRKPLKATDTHEPVVTGATTHLVLVTGLDAVGKPLDDTHVHRAGLFSRNTGLELKNRINEAAIAASTSLEIKKAVALGTPLFTSVFLNKADTLSRITSGRKIAALLRADQMMNRVIDHVVTASLQEDLAVKDCLDIKNTRKKGENNGK